MRDASACLPNWILGPADTTTGLLQERKWRQHDLAARTGFTLEPIADHVRCESAITHQVAQQLSIALGSTTELWLAREAKHCATLERQRESASQRGVSNS